VWLRQCAEVTRGEIEKKRDCGTVYTANEKLSVGMTSAPPPDGPTLATILLLTINVLSRRRLLVGIQTILITCNSVYHFMWQCCPFSLSSLCPIVSYSQRFCALSLLTWIQTLCVCASSNTESVNFICWLK